MVQKKTNKKKKERKKKIKFDAFEKFVVMEICKAGKAKKVTASRVLGCNKHFQCFGSIMSHRDFYGEGLFLTLL